MATTVPMYANGPLPEEPPTCCGVEMVLIPGIAWECAEALFALIDDHAVLDDAATPPTAAATATGTHLDQLEHLRTTRIPLPIAAAAA